MNARILFLLCASILPGRGELVRVTLPLSERPGDNEVAIEISLGNASDKAVALYSGEMQVELDVDFATGVLRSLELLGGRVEATDRSLVYGALPLVQGLELTGVGGEMASVNGASAVQKDGGFSATEQVVFFDRGKIASKGFFGESMVEINEAPYRSSSSLSGQVAISTADAGYRVQVKLPLDTGARGFEGLAFVRYETTGTLVAEGPIIRSGHDNGATDGREEAQAERLAKQRRVSAAPVEGDYLDEYLNAAACSGGKKRESSKAQDSDGDALADSPADEMWRSPVSEIARIHSSRQDFVPEAAAAESSRSQERGERGLWWVILGCCVVVLPFTRFILR